MNEPRLNEGLIKHTIVYSLSLLLRLFRVGSTVMCLARARVVAATTTVGSSPIAEAAVAISGTCAKEPTEESPQQPEEQDHQKETKQSIQDRVG